MKLSRNKLILPFLVLVLAILACNMPRASSPTPFSLATPDLTLTAVFNTNPNLMPTATFPLPGTAAGITEPTTTVPSSGQSSPVPQQPTATLAASTATATTVAATPVPPTATLPPPPTATHTAVSFAGPAVRDNIGVVANYMQVEPKIDGVFDEWNLERYAVASLVDGGGNWGGERDLSGNFMVAWDDNFLYIAARVRDDRFVQNATGENLFKGDSVEVLLDTNVAADFYLDRLSGDDFQIGISPGTPSLNANPENYLWYPQSGAGFYRKLKSSATPTDDGYRLEMKIPWNIVGIVPNKGQNYGFAFSISDNDDPNRNVQQSMVSSVATRALTDPMTWGNLTLSGNAAPAPNPGVRSGANISAAFLTAPPVLDGSLGEWSLTQYPVNHVVYDIGKWDDVADLSGSVMVGWDDANLYLGVRAVDKRYVQNTNGANLYLGDSLELLLDTRVADDFFERSLSGDDYQLGISPGTPAVGTAPESYLWYPQSQAGGRPQVKIATVAVDGGYNVEIAIPWSVFGVTPAGGQHYGFAFSISDNDNPNQNAQQSLASSTPGRVLTDPTTWGDLALVR